MLFFDDESFARMFREMLLGVAHLHDRRVMHRSIRLLSYVVGHDGSVKLGDFRHATRVPSVGLVTTLVGSASHMSPEMLNGAGYDEKVDLWSLGVSCYRIITGRPLYDVPNHMLRGTIAHSSIEFDFDERKSRKCSSCSPGIIDLAASFLRSLLQRNSHERATAKEALASPLFHGTAGTETHSELISSSASQPPLTETGEHLAQRASGQFVELEEATGSDARALENDEQSETEGLAPGGSDAGEGPSMGSGPSRGERTELARAAESEAVLDDLGEGPTPAEGPGELPQWLRSPSQPGRLFLEPIAAGTGRATGHL